MAYGDTEAAVELRSMVILGPDGDLEVSWGPESDAKVREIIEKKMKEGVRFFVLKPLIGDVIHTHRKMKKMSDLQGRSFKIKDADIKDRDIAALFSAGVVDLDRSKSKGGGTIETERPARNADDAVRHRTVGVQALAGG